MLTAKTQCYYNSQSAAPIK